jgi:hypothetical protein
MPFHVEIKRGFRHARAFNLDDATLQRTVIRPWIQGQPVDLGEKEWIPRDCTLRVLEGPELAGPDLAMGRAWDNAERSAENVTRRLVEAASAPAPPLVAVLAEGPQAADEIGLMLGELGAERVAWADLRARLLAAGHYAPGGPDPGAVRYAALLVVESRQPPASWLFDAGLARGALGGSALVVQLGEEAIPEALASVEVLRLRPADQASLRALGERLGLPLTAAP